MCCHVSNKPAYAEEEQVAVESMEQENDAKKGNDDDKVSPPSGLVEGVEKKGRSPSYSHSSSRSDEEVEIDEQPLKKTVEDAPEKSPTKAVINTVKPVKKKDGSSSHFPSPPKSQEGEKILKQPEKVIVVDPPEKSPTEAIENTGGFDWYKLDKEKDKGCFIDKVDRHASSLTLT